MLALSLTAGESAYSTRLPTCDMKSNDLVQCCIISKLARVVFGLCLQSRVFLSPCGSFTLCVPCSCKLVRQSPSGMFPLEFPVMTLWLTLSVVLCLKVILVCWKSSVLLCVKSSWCVSSWLSVLLLCLSVQSATQFRYSVLCWGSCYSWEVGELAKYKMLYRRHGVTLSL